MLHSNEISNKRVGCDEWNSENCKTSENEKKTDHKVTTIYEAFSPLISSLKVCGLYYVRPQGRKVTMQQIYCWTLSAVPFTSVLIELSAFAKMTSIDINFMLLINCLGYTLLCAANVLTCVRNAQNPKYVRKFFLGFERLNRYGGSFVQANQVRQFAKIVCIVSWILYLANFGMMVYSVFATTFLDVVFSAVPLPPSHPALKIVLIVALSIIGLQWIFSMSVETCFSTLLFMEYRKFYKNMKKKIRCNAELFHKSIETDRKRFVEMSRIVESADQILAIHHGASFACNIANLCVLLYSIAYYSKTAQVSFIVIWLILFAGDIINVCISGILVNATVKNCFILLHTFAQLALYKIC